MATIRNLNSHFQRAQPMAPRGWFRWLHDHFAGRRALHDPGLEQKLAEQGWGEFPQRFPNLSPKERAKLIPIIARHAWSVGRLELIELAESSWGRLGPGERGAILAGLSEADPRAELLDWLPAAAAGLRILSGVRLPAGLQCHLASMVGCSFGSPEFGH
jgi:hypothetical protein